MTKYRISLVVFVILLLVACTSLGGKAALSLTPPGSTPQTVTVFAAASLTEALTRISAQFEAQNPDVKVIINFAGSQQLAQQLAQGAPADVFASADRAQMLVAIEGGRILTSDVLIFANNHLALIYPRDNPGRLEDLEDLAKPGLALAIASEAVPIGHYTLQFLEMASRDHLLGMEYKDNVLRNVVSFEGNVRAVLSKVLLGEVDAGFVYASDLYGANGEDLGLLAIPQALNPTAEYFIAPVDASQQPELAAAYISFLFSPDGQSILKGYGLLPVSQTASSFALP